MSQRSRSGGPFGGRFSFDGMQPPPLSKSQKSPFVGYSPVDEDDMASDSATKVPTQQSVKAYVDTREVSSSTDNAIVRFNGTTGGTQNSGVKIDDSDNVTSLGEFIGANIPVSLEQFGGQTAEAAGSDFDNTTAFNSAIAYLVARGGGKIVLRAGTYCVGDTVYVNASEVHIEGQGAGNVLFPTADATTKIKWIGTAIAHVFVWGNNATGTNKFGGSLSKIQIDGNGIVQYGLTIKDHNSLRSRNLCITGTTVAAYYETNSINSGNQFPTGLHYHDNLTIDLRGLPASNDCHGVHFDGKGTGAEGVTSSTFIRLRIQHADGDGIRVGERGDFMTLIDPSVFNAGVENGETGKALRFMGSASAASGLWYINKAGFSSGVYVETDEAGYGTVIDRIDTIDTMLSIYLDPLNEYFSGGGAASIAGTDQDGRHYGPRQDQFLRGLTVSDTEGTPTSRASTNKVYIYNNAADHLRLGSASAEWVIRLVGTDFQVDQFSGTTGKFKVAKPVELASTLLLAGDPSLALQAATKQYVDGIVAANVVGPASATNNNFVVFDGTTGKLIKDGGTLAAVATSGSASDLSTGTLAVARGGTGTGTAFTLGSILFAGASGVYSQDNAKFFWDDTNKRLGIGTTGPATPFDIVADSAAFAASFRGRSADGISILRFMNNGYTAEYGAIRATSAALDFRVGGTNVPLTLSATTVGVTLDRALALTNQTSAAGAGAGTLGNAPVAGNPGYWLKITINGVNYAVPAWAG